eukprot:CAMPEP_0174334718 /NCGR_PEP_ID=MMETSP0810-20121108/20156_1 /TAXON_ID=73025 ORGANISM="Eutreptiella gymnastica-like, Strain CCMP1594" /NCGR_SAMPLE_ID=MMETSP0810 /ASSEMBLY_ACC=CAM_ASM_000659 /LENGTH=33 /DNA_ID= /DNA_START= /DNA_END= /DNA_ORIENTATION=
MTWAMVVFGGDGPAFVDPPPHTLTACLPLWPGV